MLQDTASAELNLALRDNLTLINKGFVQALCLRFHDSKQRAQLAYADNLAETRRLMQLLLEMQRQDIPLDPDGISENLDRGGPDLQSKAKDIWLSDFKLATRKFESLRRGQTSLKSSRPDSSGSLGLDRLIEEGEEFVAELRDRSNGIENLDQLDPTKTSSQAEKKTLEDFLGYVEGIEEAFLVGKTETTRPENDPVFTVLNTVLSNHFLAIDQFFLHGFLLHKLNEKALAEERIKHSVDEMKGAFRAVQRILVLGSVPRSIFLQDIRSLYRVLVGSNPLEAIRNDLELTEKLIVNLQRAKELAENASESRSVDMLSDFIDRENNAKRRLSKQLEQFSKGETSGKGSGKIDAMLDRWVVEYRGGTTCRRQRPTIT